MLIRRNSRKTTKSLWKNTFCQYCGLFLCLYVIKRYIYTKEIICVCVSTYYSGYFTLHRHSAQWIFDLSEPQPSH